MVCVGYLQLRCRKPAYSVTIKSGYRYFPLTKFKNFSSVIAKMPSLAHARSLFRFHKYRGTPTVYPTSDVGWRKYLSTVLSCSASPHLRFFCDATNHSLYPSPPHTLIRSRPDTTTSYLSHSTKPYFKSLQRQLRLLSRLDRRGD